MTISPPNYITCPHLPCLNKFRQTFLLPKYQGRHIRPPKRKTSQMCIAHNSLFGSNHFHYSSFAPSFAFKFLDHFFLLLFTGNSEQQCHGTNNIHPIPSTHPLISPLCYNHQNGVFLIRNASKIITADFYNRFLISILIDMSVTISQL